MDEVLEFDASDLAELPIFANEEAKAVHGEILRKRALSDKAQRECDDNVERIKTMDEHLRNVQQEVSHTTGLLHAKEKEIQSEVHGTELAKREAGRYMQEVRREQGELEKHEALLNTLQNQVFEANEKMDKFKLQMNWNQEELEQWALAAKQKDEDNMALERYARADEVKINALSLQIEKLTKTDLQRRVELENEKTETAARQIELDRTAEEFRSLHTERQQLVRQWKDAVDASKRRDEEIKSVAAAYMEERQRKEARKTDMRTIRDELKRRHDANADLESKVGLLERHVQSRRDDVTSEKARVQKMHDDIDVVKSELAASARSLLRKRKENERAAHEIASRRGHLERCRKQYHEAKQRLEAGDQTTAKVEATAAEAEKELHAAENAVTKREKKITTLKERMFKESQALFALRQEEANCIAEISGAQAQARNLQAKIRQLDAESVHQQELVYNAEFQIQQMERKVARGLGERSEAEKRQLKAQIDKLEKELEAARDQKKMLATQTRRLANELRAAERRSERSTTQQRDLNARITELELENTSAEQSLKTQITQEEEAMVQNDMMRLDLKRLRDALGVRADKVFTLENRKQQLKLSMQERKKEIAVHRDVQAAQLRLAEEERHKVKIEVGQRKQHVDKLAAKYETLCKSSKLRSSEDDGEPKSQAYYLIQAAQKREELQRQGDDLDQEIRRREREMRALEATLAHVNTQNSTYRQSFQKANMKSPDADDLHQLEEQSKLARDALFRRKKELQRLSTDYEDDERRLEQVEMQCSRLEERNANLDEARRQMETELEAQDESLDKVAKRLNRLSAMHREKLSKSEETVQELAFRAQGLFESNAAVVDTLHELGNAYPEVRDILNNMLHEAALVRPAQ
ncbi:hypothetical protein CTAYLR_010263 [Chrysophaeum taylorii]|uniref:Coiled-coil domain-containing protein 39 n=1 Tax=Chrysophaeum taylorii TaxID=2483200 RepID=A0AAD7UJG0_9STRA|nr:hypothetical protein CTAYLR_010263 [Chrysophaeum taylorii]